jgi:hypothetical protein
MFNDNRKKNHGLVDLRSANVVKKAATSAPKHDDFLSTPHGPEHRKITRRPIKKRSSFLLFLIVLLLVLAGASIASFFIFDQGKGDQSLRLTLAAAKSVSSGEEVTLEIGYENLDTIALQKMQVVVEYPKGFYFNSASQEPVNQESNIWNLPDLGVGQKGTLSINGQLIGKVEENKEFKMTFQYRPSNFNSDFSETLAKAIKISQTLFPVNLTAPEKIEEGQTVNFKGDFKNEAKQDLNNLFWSFDLGEAFMPLSLTPTTSINYQWSLPALPPGEKKDILVEGKINSAVANPLPWYFKIWQKVDFKGNQQERILYEQSGQVEVVAPVLKVGLELSSPDKKINWGDEVDLKLTYENIGKIDVKEAVLKLALNQYIDWPRYKNQTNATIDGNTLIWLSKSGNATVGLSNIPVGTKGELLITVPFVLEPKDLMDYSPDEAKLEATASAMIKYNDQELNFNSEKLLLPLISAARLQAEARYYLDSTPLSGASTKVGSGPLPPVVGQETKYRIYWKLFTGSSGLSNVAVKASLPSYINFVGGADNPTLGTPLKFDSATREVSWEINEAAPNTGLMASFDVSVKPSTDQVNQLLILSNPAMLNAQEKDSNNFISKTTNLLTSDLTADLQAKGKGRVMVK